MSEIIYPYLKISHREDTGKAIKEKRLKTAENVNDYINVRIRCEG